MAENTRIEWADHTFNPWVGCTKVSSACDNCYAESWAKRTGRPDLWRGERRRTSDANWRQPLAWDRKARDSGGRAHVFCASLADVFDNQADPGWLADLWRLIRATPNLVWMLLTKRPQNIAKMLPDDWGGGYPNVWLGTTAENQGEADRRIPNLLLTPARLHFLSCEPVLGPIDLTRIRAPVGNDGGAWKFNCFDTGDYYTQVNDCCDEYGDGPYRENAIGWVICGGESGPGARPMHLEWAQSLRNQCIDAGVPFFFKQWGEWEPGDGDTGHGQQFYRVGKKRSGAMLDGREWREMPE